MSTYTITANAPLISSEGGEMIDTTVQNTGSKACWLSKTPGICTYGFRLLAGATKIWPAGDPLYIQCDAGNTTTVTVAENSGAYYAPSVLNNPAILWENLGATFADGVGGVGGVGDPWVVPTGNTSYTDQVDCTNYNSVIVSISELGLRALAYHGRDITVTWYNLTRSNTLKLCYVQEFGYLCAGNPAQSPNYPQLMLHLPTRGEFVQISIGAASNTVFTGPEQTVECSIVGDSRTIQKTIARISNLYYYVAELGAGTSLLNADLAFDSSTHGTGMAVAAGASPTFSVSHISGQAFIMCRVTTTTALVQATRIELHDRETGDVVFGSIFPVGNTGALYYQAQIYLPTKPVYVFINNAQAGTSTFYVALSYEEI